ncbi:hypothetical protein MTR_4g057095 [Medicago truncatula]|uniref:Uncharacterized protein n=1 Tax=Medicago truncatula TaxID=3880 RepID=A0A072UKM5_MEDTR|nr:hypothetical protein MTR_4g057095 [Medicago truncatula]
MFMFRFLSNIVSCKKRKRQTIFHSRKQKKNLAANRKQKKQKFASKTVTTLKPTKIPHNRSRHTTTPQQKNPPSATHHRSTKADPDGTTTIDAVFHRTGPFPTSIQKTESEPNQKGQQRIGFIQG